MAFKVQDYYFKKAKENNWVARSIFKLEEIDKKHRIFKTQQKILDLGAAPGSWAQYIVNKIGPQGMYIGLDLKEISLSFPNAHFVKMDAFQIDWPLLNTLNVHPPFDVVCSDMAPSTTGIRITDQARSHDLCVKALDIAKEHLRLGGHFICKLFTSEYFKPFEMSLKTSFRSVHCIRPDSTRKSSTEVFLVGIGLHK